MIDMLPTEQNRQRKNIRRVNIMFKKLSKKKGFTLMEMMIVVAIIAILIAIIIPTF